MPLKLNIPGVRPTRPPLQRRMAFRKRGAEGRRIEKAKLDQLVRNRESWMFVVLICTTLWGFFWFQFVIGVVCNMPALYSLSGGRWAPPFPEYYSANTGPFPWSLAWTFVVISVFASVMGLIGAWAWTASTFGKWRMRFAVLIFCIFPTGWSIAGLKAEYGVGESFRKQIDRERRMWRWVAMEADYERNWKAYEWELKRYRERVEDLEKQLEQWESGNR